MISRSLFPIQRLSWSPDGRHIAICGWGGAKTIRILSAATLTTERVYRGHSPHVRGLAWSPDGQHMLSTDLQTAHLWNTDTGELVSAYARDNRGLFSPGWSHDGRYVAAVAWREAAFVWRPSTKHDIHDMIYMPIEEISTRSLGRPQPTFRKVFLLFGEFCLITLVWRLAPAI
jgi:WD40 repeat protein